MAASPHPGKSGTCAISKRSVPWDQLTPLSAVRPRMAAWLTTQHPDLQPGDLVSDDSLNEAREAYVRGLLATQMGELTQLEEDVVASLHRQEVLAENPDDEEEKGRTVGQVLADRIASFGGSWRFIISFGVVVVAWMAVNVVILRSRAFDPYPFILLNLALSCLAALQAPLILMSQKRLEERDRRRAQGDYKINLKAELEIRHLHEKMDFLLKNNSERMMEIQQIQLDLMREIAQSRH